MTRPASHGAAAALALAIVAISPPEAAFGAAVTPPRVVVRAPAEYPAWAVGSGVGTDVELKVLVGRDGRVREARVVPYNVKHDILTAAMRASFDSAAVRAVRSWTFQPATQAGAPVPARLLVRVLFTDPADEVDAAEFDSTSAARDTLEGLEIVDRLPAPIDRETPEWPAAARYVCRGRVIVQAGVGVDGAVRAVRIHRRLYRAPDSLLAAAIDSAVIRAAWRWRYARPEFQERPAPVVVAIAFRIPDPPDVRAVVGCARDSLSGRLLPGAEIYGRERNRGLAPQVFGRTDDTGWFVLKGAAVEARSIRAHTPCKSGGFRRPRVWIRPGDEMTLYVWQNTCIFDGR